MSLDIEYKPKYLKYKKKYLDLQKNFKGGGTNILIGKKKECDNENDVYDLNVCNKEFPCLASKGHCVDITGEIIESDDV